MIKFSFVIAIIIVITSFFHNMNILYKQTTHPQSETPQLFPFSASQLKQTTDWMSEERK